MSVLEASDIVKVFGEGDAATRVLNGVSASIEAGEFVALVGASGSGKSTFLSISGTLLTPTSGALRIAGENALGLNERALSLMRNRHLGFVFQFHHLLEEFTALENIVMPVYGAHERVGARWRARAEDLLERMGLSQRSSSRASQLSGGQKQRVAVARALIMKPDIVLADEPTGNLDRANSDELMELLRELSSEEGTAFLISTHDSTVAARCDRTLALADGVLTAAAQELVKGRPEAHRDGLSLEP